MALMSDLTQSIHLSFGLLLLLLLLLLTVPMLLWGRCGRQNSPPASSVVDILRCCSDGSHVRFNTVYPSLLWSSSSSSPSCSHVVVGSLRQRRFSSSQFCRGHPPPLLRWLTSDFTQSIHLSFGLPLLLLLAVPTLLWGRCGRHNSPTPTVLSSTSSSAAPMALMSDFAVYPSLLWSSSSSPGRCHLQCSSSHIFLFSSLHTQTTCL